ncbi:protein SMG9-like isoform X3 [Benincasa hispida]|uniref:protein SMG9-like isoform X3 n=1 Tax=Benincasa hispida TaxID=102211 RepID=UPI0018FF6C64|nr:protein SMG9-like isoform X3 [Benincasa hispida]
MAGSTGANSSSNPSPAPPPPKILLAKPGLVTGGPINSKIGRGTGADDEAASIRSRLPSLGSLNLLSDSWDLHIDRFLPFLTENTEFKVVGIIGPPGVGKSTIMNEIYGYDGSSPGMLPPFPILSEDVRAMARHCTLGIEPRISSERIILLDTQPVFSPSVLAEIMRPDGSSTISVISGEPLSAELAHELMSIQLGILLASICNIVLVISEGVHDLNMWQLMLTVDLLKHGLPDPSSPISSHPQNSNIGSEKEYKEKTSSSEDYMATPIFVHAKNLDVDGEDRRLLVIPNRNKDDSTRGQYESFNLALWKLRDQVLSMNGASFSRTVSERDWLKNSVKIWESVKSSPIVMEYARTLQSSGMFRR